MSIMVVTLLYFMNSTICAETGTMYEVLGLEPTASTQEIKKSFRGACWNLFFNDMLDSGFPSLYLQILP